MSHLPRNFPRRHTSPFAFLVISAIVTAQETSSEPFVCAPSSSGSTYNATPSYQGCYHDQSVSILTSAKISTIAMTPQYCANYCGERGYKYGGINFGTQCFCGTAPNLAQATKTGDGNCSSKCYTQPEQRCGSSYVMSLYEITNPQGSPPDPLNPKQQPPACQTWPFCSQKACDTSVSVKERVKALVEAMTLEEKVLNMVDSSAGAERLGLPSYEWWSEATHGVGSAPGVFFPKQPAAFGYATSFPAPILTAASFDDELFKDIGEVVGKEGRAFGNYGFAGLDYWAPNMNPFRDPRWGRGDETPGEDTLLVSGYTRNYVSGLQGDDPTQKQIIATCKHYAAYDLETGRVGNNYDPTQQDLADYYLAPFKTCVRDTHVGSIMCSYNAIGGIPTCANEYLLQEVLRDYWNFTADYQYVVSDCGSVGDIHTPHNFTDTAQGAASVALNAGVDLDCGQTFLQLNGSLADQQVKESRMDEALERLYSALFSVGYFDGGRHASVGWADVATPEAIQLAYQAAVEGMTLLKNTDLLPLDAKKYKSIAVIGPYANATSQMQGGYFGRAPFIISPMMAFQNKSGWDVHYAYGTDINAPDNTTGFADALTAARAADVVLYCGGIDGSLERETRDRQNLTWPGNQLELIDQLSALNKPLIVAQFGGGQVDDSSLVSNENVHGLVWAGYPSQDGGTALRDLLLGTKAFAGRLPITQYPASYANETNIFDINLRPNATSGNPGRTYKWYTGKAVFPFGFGLHYTNFSHTWNVKQMLQKECSIADLVSASQKNAPNAPLNDLTPFTNITINTNNMGTVTSDYTALLFLSSSNAGPAPRPNKSLVAYARAHDILPGQNIKSVYLSLTLGSLARADENGDLTIWPGEYELALDVDERLKVGFELKGEPVVIESLPRPRPRDEYQFAVPVHYQAPSNESHGSG